MNSYEIALGELIKKKAKGKEIVAPESEPSASKGGDKIVDLRAALRKSVKGEKTKVSAKKRGGKKAS